MKKFKFLLFVAALYFAGFFTGICMQNVNAVVRAPGESNQPTSSQATRTNPSQQPMVKKVAPRPIAQKPIAQAQNTVAQPQNTVPAQPLVDRQFSPPAAADDRGATLYSLSSSMRVDIERLEDDIAILKNKVNILNNMR